ncbi:MAG TPA: hypothetical protein VHX17_01390 [Candidatus Cybelea sp.]|nr:hypothetical protein [Candidatus Cybelea sp.]
MKRRARLALLTAFALLGAGAPQAQLDSAYVLQRYAIALQHVASPAVVVYSYTVSQVGPSNIEQRHRIYRSGASVRDETLAVNGIALRHKVVRFSQREERYTVGRFAPSPAAYELLFLGTSNDGHHLDYVYEATPLSHTANVWIDRLTIDGVKFLPRAVRFHSTGTGVAGNGEIEFGGFGKFWLPLTAGASAFVGRKLARERIVWAEYRFPESLPPSTFQTPKPLPRPTLPAF